MASPSPSADRALTPAILLEARVRVLDHVVHRRFPTETVVLNLQTGRYHGLNVVAGRMLEALEQEESIGAAARIVADEYSRALPEVEHDLCVLCMDLADRDLVSVTVRSGR